MLASMPHAAPEPHRAIAACLPYQYATTPWPPSSVPLDTASMRPKAGTTAPAGSTSILSSPPAMSFTLLAKSRAYSWKMSFADQVDCQRMEVGPVACWPLPIIGNASAEAPAAPARNLRRVVLLMDFLLLGVRASDARWECCLSHWNRRQ